MVVRVVKMTFADLVESFEEFFEAQKDKIKSCEGSAYLELWQDDMYSNIFFTYSDWTNEAALYIIVIQLFLAIPGHKPNKCLQQKPKPYQSTYLLFCEQVQILFTPE